MHEEDGLLRSREKRAGTNGSSGLLGFRRKPQLDSMIRLEDGYSRLIFLVECIRKHMDVQDERSRQIADALSSLAKTVSRLPDTSSAQEKKLAVIAEHLETAGGRLARWESTVAQFPNLADAQRETLAAVGEQLALARQSQEHVAKSLEGFGSAVGSFGDSVSRSANSMQEIQASTVQRDEQLTTLLADYNRRFARVFVAAMVMAGVMVAAVSVLLVIR